MSLLRAPFRHYRTWLFDCDGVLLDSNRIKTQAFAEISRPYGEAAQSALVEYHVQNGGISRFAKLQYLFDQILKRPPEQGELEACLDGFADYSRRNMLSCPEAPRLRCLLAAAADTAACFVVSGGLQDELREVLRARGLAAPFRDILGSPASKHEILHKLKQSGQLATPAVFIGDSRYDYRVASDFSLDFVFVADWSEWSAVDEELPPQAATRIANLAELLI